MVNKELKVLTIVGARPNFMKAAPIIEEMKRTGIKQILIHTGQHYDHKMSKLFFDDLGLPEPDINLGVGSGTHAVQTGEIMKRVEPVFIKERPDIAVVVGDVNSTLACALVASKMGIRIAHVEAGLRSFDRSMPEEINRILTDAIADYLFVSEESGMKNLKREGTSGEKVYFVGNTMIDTLMKYKSQVTRMSLFDGVCLRNKAYAILTLHRQNNVNNKVTLKSILKALLEIAGEIPIIFPVHPRTLSQINSFGLGRYLKEISDRVTKGIYRTEPLGYLEFLRLMIGARMVFTDSGGIQEETTVLGIPCLTLRDNTERPVTVTDGTNVLVGASSERIIREANKRLNGCNFKRKIPRYWDGRAAKRIVKVLIRERCNFQE